MVGIDTTVPTPNKHSGRSISTVSAAPDSPAAGFLTPATGSENAAPIAAYSHA